MGLGFVDVIKKAEIRLGIILPTYKKIFEIYNIEQEVKTILNKGYGIKFGVMSEAPMAIGATGHFTSIGELIIVLTNSLKIRGDNQSRAESLYSDIETLIRSFRDGSRLGSSVIIDLSEYRVSEPSKIMGE